MWISQLAGFYLIYGGNLFYVKSLEASCCLSVLITMLMRPLYLFPKNIRINLASGIIWNRCCVAPGKCENSLKMENTMAISRVSPKRMKLLNITVCFNWEKVWPDVRSATITSNLSREQDTHICSCSSCLQQLVRMIRPAIPGNYNCFPDLLRDRHFWFYASLNSHWIVGFDWNVAREVLHIDARVLFCCLSTAIVQFVFEMKDFISKKL